MRGGLGGRLGSGSVRSTTAAAVPEQNRSFSLWARHSAETADAVNKKLRLLTRREFVDNLYRAAYKGRCLLAAFNLPFDLSRVAYDFTTARGRFAGGFALELWSYINKNGRESVNPHRPRIAIKHIDS